MTSVLQYWVMDLPLREQGTILTAVRGCDLAPKPMDGESTERGLTAFLRYCALNPADPREVGIRGAFFSSEPPESWRASELGHYPMHWYSHVMHAFEVVAYRCPYPVQAAQAEAIYREMVHSLHLDTEPRWVMVERLSEDRIAAGTVVS